MSGRSLRAGQLNQTGLRLAVEDRRDRRSLTWLALQRGVKAILHQQLARATDRREAGLQRFDDAFVAPAIARIRNIGLEQNPRLEKLAGGPFALADHRLQRFALFGAQPHHVLLDPSPRHDRPLANQTDGARESRWPFKFNDAR